MEEGVVEKYKRVAVVQDDDGHNYIIPFEMVEEFNYMVEPFGIPVDVSSNSFDFLYEERAKREDEFIEKFSQYETGGDINLVKLYIKENA